MTTLHNFNQSQSRNQCFEKDWQYWAQVVVEFSGKRQAQWISIYQDKSFTFELKSPPAAALILKAAKIQKGAAESGVQVVGKITFDQAKEIGKQKMQDLNAMDEDAAAMIIAGTARSMGIEVEGI